MSYRNNQFYYANSAGEESQYFNQGGTIPPADNPPFIYPDSTIRVADPSSNRPSGLTSRKLERGYIRSLLTEAQGQQVPLKKCRFQFNPSQLAQSVSMNASMLNFFMQDPAQLAQPLGSEVSFAFDVFFDRSMEMNNPRGGVGDPASPWASSSPSEVGVLRDIASFYSVIGQGISADQVDFAKAQYANTLNAEFNDADGAIEESDRQAALERLNDYTTNINVNVGNTAFLMPLPVRVLFSSLYMVEGYVTNTTVVYTKFNTSMVPMQATMSVTMRALYIGFAKKDTFVTENIKKTIEAEQKQAQEVIDARAAKKDAYLAMTEELSVIEWTLNTATQNYDPASLEFALSLASTNTNLSIKVPNAKDNGSVSTLFKSGAPLAITYQLQLKVYGPFDNLGQIASTGKPKTEAPNVRPLLVLSASSRRISSSDNWSTYVVDKRTNGSAAAPSNSLLGGGTLSETKFYSIVIEGAATIKVDNQFITAKVSSNVRKGQGSDSAFFDVDQEGKAVLLWDSVLDDSAVDALPAISDYTPPTPSASSIEDVADEFFSGLGAGSVTGNIGGGVSNVS
jgi:hypothetical protein